MGGVFYTTPTPFTTTPTSYYFLLPLLYKDIDIKIDIY